MPVADYPVAAFGVNLPSDLAEPIEITSVEALGLDDLHVDSIQLMPVSETFRLLAEAYPPTESFPEAWPRSTAAVGRTVEAGAVFDLVLEVRSGPEGGSLDGIRVRYTAGGREFVADTVVELVLSPTPCV